MLQDTLSQIQAFSVGVEATIFGAPSDAYFAQLAARPGQDISGHNPTFMRVAERLAPDATIIDIGANIGLTTLPGARLVPHGKVIAVEPSPRAFSALQRMVDANGLTNCEPVNICMGARSGRVEFVEDAGFLAGSYVGADAREAATTKVKMTTLDKFLSWRGMRSVDLVKVDVEGFELDVLQGAIKTIRRYNPTFVMEFNSFAIVANQNKSPRALLDFILDRFGSFRVYRDGRLETFSTTAECRCFIHDNMTLHSCVEDIIFGRDIDLPDALGA